MWVGGWAECWTERRTGNWINDYGVRQAGNVLDKNIIRCGKDTDFFIYHVNPARQVECTVKLGHTTYKFTRCLSIQRRIQEFTTGVKT